MANEYDEFKLFEPKESRIPTNEYDEFKLFEPKESSAPIQQQMPNFLTPMQQPVQEPEIPQQQSFGQDGLQIGGQLASGFNQAILGSLGSLIDLPFSAGKAAGLPVEPFANEALTGLLPQPPEASTMAQKLAHGVGTGVGDAASFMIPGSLMAKLGKAGGMVQGIGRKMAEQPLSQSLLGAVGGGVTESTDNPLLGMAASVAAPLGARGLKSVVAPIQRQLTPEQARLIASAKSQGVPVTPGQETGSKMLKKVESQLAQLPFSSKPQLAIYDEQAKVLNKMVLKKAGIDSEYASPTVLDKGFDDLGEEFNRLADRTTLNVDPTFFDEIENVANVYGRRLGSDKKPKFQSRFDDLMEMAKHVERGQPARSLQQMLTGNAASATKKVQIDGATYKRIATDLREAIRGETDSDTKNALLELKNSFDDIMTRSTANRPEIAASWKDVRNRYRNLLIIDKAMQQGTSESGASGVLTASGLKNAVKSFDRSGYSRGRGELNEISRIIGALKENIPDSGTAQRTLMNNLLTFGAGTGIGLANPVLLSGFALPPVIQKMMNSKAGRAYLTNQMNIMPVGPQKEAIKKALLVQATSGDFENLQGY